MCASEWKECGIKVHPSTSGCSLSFTTLFLEHPVDPQLSLCNKRLQLQVKSLSLCQWLWSLLNDGVQRAQRAWMLEARRALAMWYLLRKSKRDSVFSVHLYQLRWRQASWLEMCTDPRKCCGLWGNAGSPGIVCTMEETGWLCSDILRVVLRKSTHQTLSLVKWQKMLLWLEAAAGNV